MKYLIGAVLVCLTAHSAQSLDSVPAVSNRTQVYVYRPVRDLVDPSTCASTHNASFASLQIEGMSCSIQNCTLISGKGYNGNLEFIAGKTEWDVVMEISFVALPPLQDACRVFSISSDLFKNFTKGEKVKMSYSLTFYKKEFKNKSGPYRLQFQVYSSSTDDEAMLLCKSIFVNLNTTSTDNEATSRTSTQDAFSGKNGASSIFRSIFAFFILQLALLTFN